MLTIYSPFPEARRYPSDEDEWFIDSLAELVHELVVSIGGSVGGIESGTGEMGICVFEANPKEMLGLLSPLLKRHCPKGTHMVLFYEDDEDEKIEEESLFRGDETPQLEPLPLKNVQLAYRPFEIESRPVKTKFLETDKYIFEAIASSSGISRQYLNNAIDYSQRMILNEDELTSGIVRLMSAGYIYSEVDKYFVNEDLLTQIPRTANGKVSGFRHDAWKSVHKALFNL